MRGLKRGIIFVFVLLAFSFSVSAIDDLISLQGNVQQGTVNLASGNLTVYIYDAIAGGNLVWNSTLDSTGQYNNSIVSGKYDVMLGNSSTNVLNLEYGQLYYVEMYVNSEKFSFGGSDRQILQSSVGQINASFINPGQINVTHLNGNITFSYITGGENVVFSNTSTTFTDGNNLTLGVGGWFKGLFNWVIDSSSAYLTFNGTTLTFDEAQLNTTIDSRTADDISSTIANNTYRKLDSNLFNQQLNTTDIVYFSQLNASQLFANGVNVSQWLFNQSAIAFNYNQTAPANVYTDSATASLISSTIGNNTYMLIDKNVFDQQLNTTSGVLFSELNVTNVLRVGTTLLQADNTGTLNISGTTNFNNGWQSGGVSISGGSVYVQTLYAVNITSLGVSNLNINGSLLPDSGFNNTFDVGNLTSQWRNGYFGTEVYINSQAVSPWLFNQSAIAFNYNQTAPANVYSDARFLSNFQSSFNSNITPLDLVNSIQGNLSYANIQWDYNQTIMRNIFNQDLNKSSKVVFEEFNVTNASGSVGLYQGQNTNVGIGTASPVALLHIGVPGASPGATTGLRISSYGNAIGLSEYVSNSGHIYFDSTIDDNTYNTYFRMRTLGTPVNILTLLGTGKVGIGTATPTEKLEVIGNISISGVKTFKEDNINQNGNNNYYTLFRIPTTSLADYRQIRLWGHWAETPYTGTGGNEQQANFDIHIQADASDTYPSWSATYSGSGDTNTYNLRLREDDTNSYILEAKGGFYSAHSFEVNWASTVFAPTFSDTGTSDGESDGIIPVNKNSFMGAVTVNGSVGIGTATPTQKLDVAGNVNISTLGGNISLGGGSIYWDNPNSRLVIKVS